MLMLFTCTKCDTRAGKAFSKQAYEHGLVIVTCPGCDSRHLIADNLGWMGDNGNIEDIMREKGQDAVRLTADGTVEVDPELFVGRSTVRARLLTPMMPRYASEDCMQAESAGGARILT